MPVSSQRKLQLNRETIRTLSAREMAEVAGGALPRTAICLPASEMCPTGPVGCPRPTSYCTAAALKA